MTQKGVQKPYWWVFTTVLYALFIQPQVTPSSVQQQEPPASRPTRVKIRPAEQPALQAEEQQATPPEEAIPRSGATLQTAKTIYIERLPHNLHLYITAELNKQRLPYKILLDKREADLWMVGTAEVFQKDMPQSKVREVGEVLTEIITATSREPAPLRADTKTIAAVLIVPRGSQEVLWASRSQVFSALGANQGYVAKQLVKDLRKALKKAK